MDIKLMKELGIAIEDIGPYHVLEFTKKGFLMIRCDLTGKFTGYDYLGDGVFWYSSTKWSGRRHARKYLRERLIELRRKDLRKKLFSPEPEVKVTNPKPKAKPVPAKKIAAGWYQDSSANLYRYDGKIWTDGLKEINAPKVEELEYVSK